jgi:YD repeat-containing protein
MKYLLLLLAAGAFGQSVPALVEWRLSDALGNDGGLAPLGGPRTAPWMLRVEIRGKNEERTLFRNAVEQSVRLVDRDAAGRALRVRDLRGGEPVWEVTYHPETGLPSVETTFSGGQPSEVATLTFEDHQLARREVRDADGAPLYTDRLYHWPNGTLRRIERDGPDGPLAEAAWYYTSSGQTAGAWSASETEKAAGEHREWTFAGSTTTETLVSEAKTLLTRVTEEGDAGRKDTLTDDAGRVETRITDTRGHLTGVEVRVKDQLVEVRRWKYDDQDRLVEASTESAGPPETWTYAYNADGTTLERLLRAGQLVKEVLSRDGEQLRVSLYERGTLFLVETWSQGKRVRETYYQNGAVIRERTP